MGVAEETITRLRDHYPDITVLARQRAVPTKSLVWTSLRSRLADRGSDTSGPVLAVQLTVDGIEGGRSRTRCHYRLIIDTGDLRKAIPPVWVLFPGDDQIKHVNIWPAHKNFCRWTGTSLPSFCWFRFADGWSRAPEQARTLGAALEYVKQLLSTENHDSPAR